ncbi:MAG: RDD family protein [Pedobacter sp.]|nr:MAG: RDD family protein [Pedobacter sp.]
MGPEAIYTVVIDGKPQGPYALEELKKIGIRSGTFIRKPGMDDYKEAHAIPELRELLNLKQIQTAPQYFAAFDLRLLASVIDYFALTCVFVAGLLISFIFFKDNLGRIALLITSLPVIPVAKLVYSSIAEASAKQATIGKRMAGIKVTDLMGNRISLANSFGRNLAKIFSVLPVFFGYLYSFLNKKQQCWHDIIADTLVVKERLI